MIEVLKRGERYLVTQDGHELCEVTTIWKRDYRGRLSVLDHELSLKRAEHIAEALRHYQQSQEGEKVL